MERTEIGCGVVRDLLPLYAEQAAGEESRALVEAHLSGCAGCRAELAAIQTPPQPAPQTARSLRRVKGKLRRGKLFAAAIAALAVLALALGAMGFSVRTSIAITKADILVCNRSAPNVRRGVPDQWKELFLTVPYERLEQRAIETRRARGETDQVEQVIFFTGYESARSRWMNLRYGKQPYNSGPMLDFDRYAEDPAYVYSRPQTGVEGVTGPAPGREAAPLVLAEHVTTARVYFVPYSRWEDFNALADPLGGEALAMAALLWDREADAYDLYDDSTGAPLPLARHEAGTPLD